MTALAEREEYFGGPAALTPGKSGYLEDRCKPRPRRACVPRVAADMKNLSAGTLIPGVLALAGVAALVLWAGVGPARPLEARVPGLDRPKPAGEKADVRPLVGKLTRGDGVAISLPGSWPRFRGERFDGIGEPGVPLARQWPATGPPVLWSIELGEGHAGAAVRDGRVFVLDYDRPAAADAVRCLSLADGREIWRFSYPVDVKRNHGMSRTVPAVSDKYLVALGPKCHVSCLDPASGKAYWLVDLVRQFGATVPPWYAGQCPLIDGDRAILATGGDALLVALDCQTGRVVWKSPNPRRWTMTHSSIMPMEFAGRRMFVYCGKGGVAGVSADDGSILWDTTEWKISHRHRPLAGDPARGPDLPLRRLQRRGDDAATGGVGRQDRGQDDVQARGRRRSARPTTRPSSIKGICTASARRTSSWSAWTRTGGWSGAAARSTASASGRT